MELLQWVVETYYQTNRGYEIGLIDYDSLDFSASQIAFNSFGTI